MCLAIPARVVGLHDGDEATVDIDGVQQRISVMLLDDVALDEYVVVHVGYALSRLSKEDAERTLALLSELDLGEAV